MQAELELPFASGLHGAAKPRPPLEQELMQFCEFGQKTVKMTTVARLPEASILAADTYINEFWTAKQRDASRLHEISYRACFKPQVPRFFIERLTNPRDTVYDPFMGRGTTPVEAGLLGRVPVGNDINPLSVVLTKPRLNPPSLDQVSQRLREIPFNRHEEWPEELLVFYHPDTLKEIIALKEYFLARTAESRLDAVDEWIRMVAINRLTGHSKGFFSVYTLPPNQAVSIKSQQRINAKRHQVPERRLVADLIYKKSRFLLSDCLGSVRDRLIETGKDSQFITQPADATAQIAANSVDLVVTSPPFLDVVDYATDNWLRCWFLGIDAWSVKITRARKLEDWRASMVRVFLELRRVLRPGGHIAFEVGEIEGGNIKLEESVLICGSAARLKPMLVLINSQEFTKTANCWGVDNNDKGTNTNRVVLFRKD